MLEIDLETVVAVVYEPSREAMPVLEGPGLDYNVDAGPERLFSVFGNRLYMPDGNFAGIDPVEPSTVSHTSNPPVPSGVVVSELTQPIPVFRLLLELSDLSSDGASAGGDFFVGCGRGVFLRTGWHCFLCWVRCVHMDYLEPLFLRYRLALDLCDSVSAFWYTRGNGRHRNDS